MNIKIYKYLYKKMCDDIKDAEILCCWSQEMKEIDENELSKYFGSLALERLNKSFKETHAKFANYAAQEADFQADSITKYLWEEIHQELVEHYERCLKCLEKL